MCELHSVKCNKHESYGTLNAHTLGMLRCSNRAIHGSVTIRSVFYRCVTCRMRYAINRGSLAFPCVPGGYGVRERCLCYWNLIHGASPILTVKQLELSEDTVYSFYRHGRIICIADALRREGACDGRSRGRRACVVQEAHRRHFLLLCVVSNATVRRP